MIYLEIPGEPVAKGRARITKRGIAYTPAKTKNYEVLVQELFIISKQGFLEGPLKADIKAYFTISQSKSKKQKEQMAAGEIKPTRRPDLDNVAKSVLDALNGLAYNDDSQIVELNISKQYSDRPRLELTIREA